MDLPGYIKDFLQTNYYISDEELALPFDQMKPYLRELISTKCMNLDKNGEMSAKSEEEILKEAKKQFEDDINSDITRSSENQLNNFVSNHETFYSLIEQAEKQEKNPSDFSRTAILLAAKRMASDEYASTPKTLGNFLEVKKEIDTELQVKYFTARYFETYKPTPKNQDAYHEKTLQDIAVIADMVQNGQADQIAARFKLPDTKEDRETAKGSTLSFAMAELKTFADKVEKQVKDSPFVKKVNNLNTAFKEKYPKSYMAAKLIGNSAAALTLGPAFSAYKAVAGINAMRKDFAKYKNENPDQKGRFWKFIASKEGRKKLLEVSQNTIRIIPGMRAVGIALSAVKNSANLKESIQDLKKNGFNKRSMAKVGIAAAGLLAVSVTAAYLNDDIADSINECVSNTFGSVKDGIEDVVDNIHNVAPTNIADTVRHVDLNEATVSLNDLSVDSVQNDLPDSVQIIEPEINTPEVDIVEQPAAEPVQPQETVNTVEQPTAEPVQPQETVNTVEQPTAEPVQPQETVNTVEQPAAEPVQPQETVNTVEQPTAEPVQPQETVSTVEQPAAEPVQPQETVSTVEQPAATPSSQQTEVPPQDHSAEAAELIGGKQYSTFGDRNMLVQSPDGTNSILYGDGTQKVSYEFTQNGLKIRAEGFSADSLTEQDAAIYNDLLRQAQENGSSHPAFEAQHAFHKIKIAEAIKAQYAANPTPELESQFEALSMTHRLGLQRLDLGNISDNPATLHVIPDQTVQATAEEIIQQNTVTQTVAEQPTATEINNRHFNVQDGTSDGTIQHADGTKTAWNTNQSGTTVTHHDGDSYSQVSVGRDGSVDLKGVISRDVDPTKDGATVTHVGYDTAQQSGTVILTDNQTGDNIRLSKGSTGEQVGLYGDNGSKNVKLSHDSQGFNVKGHAFETKVGDTEIRNANFNLRDQTASGTLHHENGTETAINTNKSGATVTHRDGDSYTQVGVGRDGSVDLKGVISRDVDPTKDGATVTHVGYDTAQQSGTVILTDNQTGDNIRLSKGSTGEQVGLYGDNGSKNVKLSHDSQGFNVKGHAFETKVGDTEIRNANFNLRDQTASGTLHHENGTETAINTNKSGATVTHRDGDSYTQVGVGRDGSVDLKGVISRDVDPTKDGATVTHVGYDTAQQSGTVILTDNQTGDNIRLSKGSTGEQVGLYGDNGSKNVKLSHDSQGFNVKGHAFETKVGDTEIRNANFNLRDQTASGTLHHENGTETAINTNKSGATVTHRDGDSYTQVGVGRDGSVDLKGVISRDVDPTKDGATVTHVGYDTAQQSGTVILTDNQTGDNIRLSKGSTGEQVGLYGDNGSKNVKLSHDSQGFNVKGHAFETKVGDTEIRNANFNLRDQTASGTLHHENGTETDINTNKSGATVTHRNGDSYSQVGVGRDGKIGLQGRISRAADPEKEGLTVTQVDYNTSNKSVQTVITDNKSGQNVSIGRDSDGIKISAGGTQGRTTVTIGEDGVNIKGKNGRSVNVSKIASFIRGLTR